MICTTPVLRVKANRKRWAAKRSYTGLALALGLLFFGPLPIALNAQDLGLRIYAEEYNRDLVAPVQGSDSTLYALANRPGSSWPGLYAIYKTDPSGTVLDSLMLPVGSEPRLLIQSPGAWPDQLYWGITGSGAEGLVLLDASMDTVWDCPLDYSAAVVPGLASLQQDGSIWVATRHLDLSPSVYLTEVGPSGERLRWTANDSLLGMVNAVSLKNRSVLLTRWLSTAVPTGPTDVGHWEIVHLDSTLTPIARDTLVQSHYFSYRYRHQYKTLVPDGHGGAFFAASFRGLDGGTRDGIRLRRYDSAGVQRYHREIDYPDTVTRVHVHVGPTGRFSISCLRGASPGWGPRSASVMEVNPDTGDSLWTSRFTLGDQFWMTGAHMERLDGGFVVSGYTDVDFTHTYPNFWYLTDSIGTGRQALLRGRAFYDANGSLDYDAADYPMAHRVVHWEADSTLVMTDADGRYVVPVFDPDTATLRLEGMADYLVPGVPAPDPEHLVEVSNLEAMFSGLDFLMADTGTVTDVVVQCIGVSTIRALDTFGVYIMVQNRGISPADSVQLYYRHDSKFAFLSSELAFASYLDTTMHWDLPTLEPWSDVGFMLQFVLNDTATLGDSVFYNHQLKAVALPNEGAPEDNFFTGTLSPLTSYDPNDKVVRPEGEGPEHRVDPSTPWLYYTIRFQNTGTDTAFKVRLDDDIMPELDLTSFEMLGSSHAYTLELVANHRLRWRFPGIALPDSSTDLMGSQGFVSFRMRPMADLPEGTRIENTAAIYFDFNPAVITNTAFVTLDRNTGLQTVQGLVEFQLVPNPAQHAVTVWTPEAVLPQGTFCKALLFDVNGRLIHQHSGIAPMRLDLYGTPSGVYIIVMQDRRGAPMGYARLVVQH